MKTRHLPILAALLVSVCASLSAQTAEAVIAKARTFLGGDQALAAVQSIHFTGQLEMPDGTKLPTDIVFQRPYQQRITVNGANVTEITALDGYDAWMKRTNVANPAQWQLTLLDAAQVKRLRANTLENLSFYSTKIMPGCAVEAAGEVQVDDVDCVKLVFTHSGGIIFTRYFNKATGQLVKTETDNGAEIREEGSLTVNGIRFPKRVINKNANGTVTAISFDTVTLNEVFPADFFTVPSFH